MRPRAIACALLLLVGSCIGGDEATGPGTYAELGLALQPSLIPSAADAAALPIHRVRTVVARHPDGAVLREQSFDVSPTAAAWSLEIRVPVGSEPTEVVVHLLLLHVAADGTESVQFSGRTAPLTLSVGSRVDQVDADIVRGPPSNLAVTSVAIVSAPDTLYVGASADLSAAVASSASTVPQVYWTSLDPSVLEVVDSTATGIAAGTAAVVASAGAHADTTSVVVIAAPSGGGASNRWLGGPGDWGDASKWSLGRPPLPTDTVLITEGADYTVTLDGNATVARLVIGDFATTDYITLVVDRGTLTVTDAPEDVPRLDIFDFGALELWNSTLRVEGYVQNGGNIDLLGDSGTIDVSTYIVNLPEGRIDVFLGTEGFVLDGTLVNQGSLWISAPTTLRSTDASGSLHSASHVNYGLIELDDFGRLSVQLGGVSPSFTNRGTIALSDTSTQLVVQSYSEPQDAQFIQMSDGVITGIGVVDLQLGSPRSEHAGTIAPGDFGVGLLEWLGPIAMGPTGTIALEIQGSGPSEYDQLRVSGDLTVDGTLAVTPLVPWTPFAGETIPVIVATNRIGDFAAVDLPTFPDLTLTAVWSDGATEDTLYVVVSEGEPAPVSRWINPLGGDWSDPANWSGGVLPAPTDSVAIDLDGTYTVTLDVDATVRSLTVGRDGGGGVQTLTGTSRTLALGSSIVIYTNGEIVLSNSSITGDGTLSNFGSLTLSNGTIAVPLTNSGGQIRIAGTPSFTGTFRNLPGSTVTLGALAGHTTLTVANGFTNEGTIELTTVNSAYNTRFGVANGTLVNEGTIRILPGAGGARYLSAEIENNGTLQLNHRLTIDAAFASHVNNSTISVSSSDLELLQSAEGSFTNYGTIDVATGITFYVTGGALILDEGAVTGNGAIYLGTGTDLVFTPATVTTYLRIVAGATLANDLTISDGETLRLIDGSVIDEAIDNQGTILLSGNVAFNGPLTNSGVIRVGAFAGHSTLTVADGFTNDGIIELTNTGAAYNAQLTITTGQLDNVGTFRTIPSFGGARTLSAPLANAGEVEIDANTTFDSTLLQSNGAVLTVLANRTLNVTGQMILLEGSTTTAIGTLNYSSGCFMPLGPANISGFQCLAP